MMDDKTRTARHAKLLSLTADCEVAHWTEKFGVRGASLALMIITAVTVSACGTVAIGPVDHECHANPVRSQGSGCEDYRD